MKRALMLFTAVWSPLYLAVFFVLVLEATIRNGGDPDNDLLIPFDLVVVLHLATMAFMLAGIALFCFDAFHNPRVPQDQRVMWIILLVLFAPFAMPAYWWIHVRRGGDRLTQA